VSSRKLRCAIYTRKSTDEGLDQDFNSLEAQRESCTAYIMSQTHEGWEALDARYDDGGFSGGSLERPALRALMADIEKGLIDIVVVYKVDRLTRSLADFAKLVDLFDRQRVSFVSVTQAFNTTNSMGRLTLNVLLSFAQFEREVTAERIRDKFRASKEKGMWMGGLPPLGYDIDHRKLVINGREAERVRLIFERYLELGSVMRLMKDLKSLDIRSKRWVTQKGNARGGSTFTRGALYALLQNPVYIGRIRHKDKVHDGQHEAIIDDEVWEAAQNLLARNRHESRTKTNAKSPSLLAGLLFHEDGAAYRPRQGRKKGCNHHYYVHPSGTLPVHEIDSLVANELVNLLGRQATLCQIIGTDDPVQMDVVGSKAQSTSAELKLCPRRDIFLQMVDKVTVGEKQISLAINRLGLQFLLTNIPASAQIEGGAKTPHIIKRAFQLKRCGNGRKLILGQNNADDRSQPDPSLLRTIARAHVWFGDLRSGLSYKEIASRDAIDERLVARTVRLAFLAPDITKAILAGLESKGLTSEQLVRLPRLPASWNEQRSLLGFD
jgi:site-specific DNA recombinase|tara:strand:+ start:18120 stop:19769 length:1650 start_codon:yes stop_codon:yes gene_type:complete